jgi:hypothetical protein
MKLQLRRITFGLLIVVIFSCVSRYKQERFDKFDFTQFEQHRADSILRTLNGEEYLDFFIEVVNNAHSNTLRYIRYIINGTRPIISENDDGTKNKHYISCSRTTCF